jgi:glycosyltransferase involved in cell wall biosynthesis
VERLSRLRVLHLTTEWPSPWSPTNGTFVREHAYAAATACDVAVVNLDRSPGRSGLVESEPLEGEAFPAWRLKYRRLPRPFSYVAFVVGAFRGFRTARAQGFEPDVLHAHSFLSCGAALVLRAAYRKPVAYTEHWTIFTEENPGRLSRAMTLLARVALERADVVLPVSEDLRAALAALAPRADFRVVPNAVDVSLFAPGSRSRDGRARLLTVGLLDTPRKGLDVLLGALRHVRDDVRAPEFAVDVVGDGGLRVDYETLAKRLGLDDVVRFHGFLGKPQIAELMRSSDLFVLGSRYENNPCVLIEAMATGLPVVATAVGGVPEMVDEDTGLLAPPLDEVGLGGRIRDALASLDGFDRRLIARRARERFSRESVGAALADVYGTLARR